MSNIVGYVRALTKAYIECALWGSIDGLTPAGTVYNAEHLAPKTAREMRRDCVVFIRASKDLLRQAEERLPGYDAEQAGYDFWLARSRQGADFWDCLLGEVGERLTDMACTFSAVDLYVGADGLVYSA